MGSLPATCEIIELPEEMDSVKQSKEVNRGVDGKTGKLPMLKTGRSYALEDDINQLFEAINLKTSGKRLSQSLQSDRGTSSKNASKKPIGVGSPRTSGFGTSDSPTLKQALRRLAVSHASEMAAMKRLSKSVASPRISEAETIHKLYRTVVAEPNEVGLPPDKGKGNLLEISVGTEMATMNSSQKLHKSLQVSRANSPSPNARSPRIVDATKKNASGAKIPSRRDIIPEAKELGGTKNHGKKYLPLTRTKSPTTSAHSSPRLAVLTTTTTTKGSGTKVPSQDKILSEPTEVRGENSTLKLGEKGKLNAARCLPNSNTVRDVLEEDENVPTPKLGKETSVPELEIGSKSKLYPVPSSFSSSAGIKVSKSLANRTRAVKPVFKHKSVKKKKLKRDRGEAKDDGMAIGSSKLAKHKVKQISISKSNKSSIHGEIEDGGLLPSTSQLTCQTHNFNQKNARKEYSSPASSSTSLGVEVSSGNVDSCVSKPPINSNTRKGGTVGGKVSKSTKSKSREKGDFSQSSKSSIGEYSTSTSISEESNLSGSSFSASRPHMSKDMRWDAIHQVEARYGSLGLKHFKLLKRLGCGDIGTVYLAELSGTNCAFALKVMDNEYLACRKKMPRAQTEREILQMLDHPFLPTLYAHFTTNSFSCLVMEFCPGGDLHVLRQKQPTRCFSEQAARFYVAEVLLALEYLHMLGVIYRDLKPENILVREDGHIMLSDFDLSLRCSVSPMLLQSSSPVTEPTKNASGPCIGSSCIDPICLHPSCVQVSCFTPRLPTAGKPRKQKSDLPAQVSPLPQLVAEPTSARSNSFVGTHEYLAPEIIKGEGHGSAVDWWTFGIFLYELIYGRTPFKGSGNEDTLCNVVAESLKFPEYPLVSFQARDLIRGLLVKDPDNRLGSIKGATEIKHHPFFDGLNWALIRCAVPPELPKFVNPVLAAAASAMEKEDSKCIEFNDTGDHLEIELF